MLIGFGAIQAGDAAKDQEKLQGSWPAVEIIKAGKPAPADEVKGVKMAVAEDKMTVTDRGRVSGFRIKLDPGKKPKAIDLTALDGPFKGKVVLGIYQLEGDMLKLCLSNDPEAKERPAEFAAKEGSKLRVFTFKLAKP